MGRVSLLDLPSYPSPCGLEKPCAYRQDGYCDDPRINKGNGDAACHRMLNRDVLAMLRSTAAVAVLADRH